ncbi:plexin-A4-like [Diadema setosum]|uniref:plexin-A4-like n=1 Tax=Diadema setosum TaxID=31175 RepID=UPI003B3A8D2F
MKSIIGRLCTNTTDPSLESYTQIQLECIDQTGSNYNVIQAAHIGRAGSQLADSLGINSTDDIMYAVFTKENSSPVQTALCLYKMSDIQQRFTQAVVDCITCSGTNDCKRRSIDYLMDSSCSGLAVSMLPSLGHFECMAHQDGGTAYRYARGLDALGSVPVLVWTSSIPTSIAVTYEREATVVITGTSASDLLKINVLNGSAAYMYEEISLESGPVLHDMFYDSDKEELTLGTTSRVSGTI